MRKSSLAAGIFAMAIGAGPALAATTPQPPPPSATNKPQLPPLSSANKPQPGTATINEANTKPPNERNPLLARNGEVRIGKMIGTDVYNKDDQKLGTVNGVLVDQTGVAHVVLALNGGAFNKDNNQNNKNDNNANNANFMRNNRNVSAADVRNDNNNNNNGTNTNANKKVVVPWSAFQFGNANVHGNNKILMPNTTLAKLESLGPYSYQNTKQKTVSPQQKSADTQQAGGMH